MAQKLSGGCACGAIHYECSADPVRMLNCHCRDCQQASGSGYAAIVVVPKAAIQIRGQQSYHKVIGQSGTAARRPRIAGGESGRSINLPTYDGCIHLQLAAMG